MSREGLRTIISIGLKVQPGYVKTVLAKTHVHSVLVEDLTNRIMGPLASETLLVSPSMVGPAHSPAQGRWGVDEDHPFPDLKPADYG